MKTLDTRNTHRTSRTVIGRRSRILFASVVGVMTWVGREYNNPDGAANLWFAYRPAGIPGKYFALAAVLLLVLPTIGRTRGAPISRVLSASRFRVWVGVGFTSIVVAFVVGISRGVPEPFIDWLNLAALAVVAVFSYQILVDAEWRRFAIVDVAVVYGLLSVVPLLAWVLGGGTATLGVRIPVFDGGTLQLATFASIVAIAVWVDDPHPDLKAGGQFYGTMVKLTALSSSVLILLSFRRSYWLMWSLGISAILVYGLITRRVRKPRIAGTALVMLIAMMIGISILGADSVLERVQSFLPSSNNRFSVTNTDHVNDLYDALDVIMEEPILGFGIGRYYQTTRIRNWKTASFEVHNAFLHAWLKFGILGLIAYAGFHLRWIVLHVRFWSPNRLLTISLVAAGLFLAAESVASIFGTWPYGKLQISAQHGVLLGMLLAVLANPSIEADRGSASQARATSRNKSR